MLNMITNVTHIAKDKCLTQQFTLQKSPKHETKWQHSSLYAQIRHFCMNIFIYLQKNILIKFKKQQNYFTAVKKQGYLREPNADKEAIQQTKQNAPTSQRKMKLLKCILDIETVYKTSHATEINEKPQITKDKTKK